MLTARFLFLIERASDEPNDALVAPAEGKAEAKAEAEAEAEAEADAEAGGADCMGPYPREHVVGQTDPCAALINLTIVLPDSEAQKMQVMVNFCSYSSPYDLLLTKAKGIISGTGSRSSPVYH